MTTLTASESAAAGSAPSTAAETNAAFGTGAQSKTMSDALLSAITGLDIKDAAQLVSLGASVAAARRRPPVEGQVPPLTPPAIQENRVPTQDFFTDKRRRASGDPTSLTGPGGVRMGDLLLGRATILGG